jgi:hypothetical protein
MSKGITGMGIITMITTTRMSTGIITMRMGIMTTITMITSMIIHMIAGIAIIPTIMGAVTNKDRERGGELS